MGWRHGYLQAFEFERRSEVGERPDTTIADTADAQPCGGSTWSVTDRDAHLTAR